MLLEYKASTLCNLLANTLRQAKSGQCRPVVQGLSVDDVTFLAFHTYSRSLFETLHPISSDIGSEKKFLKGETRFETFIGIPI